MSKQIRSHERIEGKLYIAIINQESKALAYHLYGEIIEEKQKDANLSKEYIQGMKDLAKILVDEKCLFQEVDIEKTKI